jgi:iron complex outermembrane receptor protein
MKQYPRFKIAPLAAAVATALSSATMVIAAESNVNSAVLEEVIVTARKRSESVMDIPSSIQALSAEDIKNMGARDTADYVRFLPSVTMVDYGSGDSDIIFRGVSTDGGFLGQASSSVYLDEISTTIHGYQPSIRMVDIERVEALAGPQGTLYGSDAQAGTLRIITNKPAMDRTEFTLDGSLRDGSDADNSYDGSVVLNVPLVENKVALRLVGFSAKDGGFIDNVLGHTNNTDTANGTLPSGWGNLDNSAWVEDDINDTETTGWRLALRWQVNENWAATLSTLHQEIDAGSPADYDRFVGELETIKFDEEFREDEYDMHSLVLEGDLGFAQLVSATSYYEREIVTRTDITNYHKSYSAYYCNTSNDPDDGPYYFIPTAEQGGNGGPLFYGAYCHAPTVEGDYLANYDALEEQDRFSQEIRLSSQGDTIDWLVGMFYEDSNYTWGAESPFGYPHANEENPNGEGNLYQDSVSLAWAEFYFDDTFPGAKAWWEDYSSTDVEQIAVFGEVVWHLGDRLDITAGLRYFDRENDVTYYEEHPGTNLDQSYALGSQLFSYDETETVPKLAISYNLNDDSMIYALWTVGYRPGGTNRYRNDPFLPRAYASDKLTNWEAGYKGTLADGSVRVSATAFYMDWEDYQVEVTDPAGDLCSDVGIDDPPPGGVPGVCGQGYNQMMANGEGAHILGTTIEIDWAVSSSFLVGANVEWLEAELDDDLTLGSDVVEKGSQLPKTPEWSGSAWATYNWPVEAVEGGNAYVRLQWSYTGSTLSNLEDLPQDDDTPNPQFENGSYDIGDLSVGLKADDWEVSLFLTNITDERAQYNHDYVQGGWTQGNSADGRLHTTKVYTNRPREYGIRLIKRWGG